MQLTQSNVNKIFLNSFYPGKPEPEAVVVEGITIKASFDPSKLEKFRTDVTLMLDQLPTQFRKVDGVGGWTFLNGVMDHNGTIWGNQDDLQELLLLGLGLGVLEFCLPKEVWHKFPGSIPYFAYLKK